MATKPPTSIVFDSWMDFKSNLFRQNIALWESKMAIWYFLWRLPILDCHVWWGASHCHVADCRRVTTIEAPIVGSIAKKYASMANLQSFSPKVQSPITNLHYITKSPVLPTIRAISKCSKPLKSFLCVPAGWHQERYIENPYFPLGIY